LNLLKHIPILIFCLVFFDSCEKVIELDLAGSKEAIVIEATITNTKLPFTVLVSKTLPYFDSITSNPVSGAKVSVRLDGGKTKYFRETAPGVYTLENIHALPGYWYIIDVEYEGVTYSARSFMNEAVPILELGFSYFDGLGFFENGYLVSCYMQDPGDQENYYRLKYYVNGIQKNDHGKISVYSDKLINGKEIGLGQRTLVFQETDTLTIELQSIDKAAYDYFSTLENITNTEWQPTASPANPISNFSNGALGYFSAYSFDRKTVVIKDYINK